MSEGINVLSLFDGISCGQVALNNAGIKVNNYFAVKATGNGWEVGMITHIFNQMAALADKERGEEKNIITDYLISGEKTARSLA